MSLDMWPGCHYQPLCSPAHQPLNLSSIRFSAYFSCRLERHPSIRRRGPWM